MKIIFIIDDFEIIDKILKHLNLWDIRNHDPPEIEPVSIPELTYVKDSDYNNSGSQIPVFFTFSSLVSLVHPARQGHNMLCPCRAGCTFQFYKIFSYIS